MKKTLLFTLMMVSFLGAFSQNSIQNPFFDKVKYRGAFGSNDWTKPWANFDPQNTVYADATDTIKGDLINSSGPTLEYEINTDTKLSPKSDVIFGMADFSDSRLQDAFFEQVDYVGAFGKENWTSGWANFDPQNTVYPDNTDTIKGTLVNSSGATMEYEINADVTLKGNKVYLLDGWFYVTDGHTLTIEPGCIIRGNPYAAIIIERGAKIMADGTADKPIVMTSNQPAGNRAWQDWGGLVLCGKAAINIPGGDAQIEGGPRTHYGGQASPDNADNSGTLHYLRVEFPGYPFQVDKEINGITFGGVGNGTTVNYVQVSYSGDDSYEWFGGTVNCKHIIAFRGQDDEFDTDNGYSGKIQFAVGLRDPNHADISGSNGFESDNDANGSYNLPYTSATVANVSLFGPLATPSTSFDPNFKRGMHLRRNTRFSVFNSIIAGYPVGLFIDGTPSETAATHDSLQIKNTIIAGCANSFAVNSPAALWANAAAEQAWFLDASRHNRVLSSNNALHLVDPFNLTAPDFTPKTATYLLDGWFYVTSGHTLTIDPGTVIRATAYSAIIVERGAKIMAEGTSDMPIIMTSNQPAGNRAWQDWGGLVLCGKASINIPGGDAQIEGGPRTHYGGQATPDDDDNSGSLKYLRVEFPGYPFQVDKEINGITFGGVGRGTSVDYVQVSYSGDDSYEWFGGTVNAKHIIAFRGQDDEFDTDNGFSGLVQYAVGLRDPNHADISGSNGFESDNDANGSYNKPYTNAQFSNVSLFGPRVNSSTSYDPNFKRGMHLRRNTRFSVYNTIVAGYPVGMFIDGAPSQSAAGNDSLKVESSVIAGCGSNFAVNASWASTASAASWFMSAERSNDTLVNNTDLNLEDPFNLEAPNFLPKSGSAMLKGSTWMVKSISITGAGNANTITTDGGSLQLTAMVVPSYAIDPSVTWELVASDVHASLTQGGLITASSTNSGNGTVTVKAMANDGSGVVAEYQVTISNQSGADVNVTGITVTADGNASEIVGSGTLQMSASVLPVDATIQDVTWSVDNENIATISQTGMLTAVNNGTVTVTATATDGSNVKGTLQIVIRGVAVEKVQKASFELFPNPVQTTLQIHSNANMNTIKVHNMLGQVVSSLSANGNSDAEVDMSTLHSGMYLISIEMENGQVTLKKVLKK